MVRRRTRTNPRPEPNKHLEKGCPRKSLCTFRALLPEHTFASSSKTLDLSVPGAGFEPARPEGQGGLSVAETVRPVRGSPDTSGFSTNWHPASPTPSGWLWAVLARLVHLLCTSHGNRLNAFNWSSQPIKRRSTAIRQPRHDLCGNPAQAIRKRGGSRRRGI